MLLCLIATGSTLAAPFSGNFKYIQPDGTEVEVWGEGDEFHAVFETLDGFTVVFDDARLAYCYAQLAPAQDKLVSTGVEIQARRGEDLGLTRHLRLRPESIRREAEALRAKWNDQMDVQPLGRRRGGPPFRSIGKMGLPHVPTLGTKVALCLLVDFEDDPATIPQADIDDFCNGTSYTGYGNWGSVRQYFHYNSNGKLDYHNVVTAYIRIPNRVHPKSWYNDVSKGAGEQGNYLIRDAIDILIHSPNFENEVKAALTGLTQNAAGEVFACNVFYAGGHSGVWSRGLWPHSYALAIVGPQELWPGGPKVNRYQVTNIGSDLNLGTFCHESGHLLCKFPDIYDYGYDSVGGAGRFCIMNSGGFAKNPVQFCAYLKAAADWATLTDLTISSSGTLTLTSQPGAGFNHFYYYPKLGIDTEYFLLECRHASGPDSALPASGIALWHIDEWGHRDNQSLDFNLFHANYEVTLVQADNAWHFQHNLNSGDANDLFYLGNPASGYLNTFSDTSSPAARWWDGSSSGLELANFSHPGPVMTVEYTAAGVLTDEAPLIVYQPASQLVLPGAPFTLKVTALGAPPLVYEWYKDSALLAEATASTYAAPASTLESVGQYCVVIRNQFGAVTSLVAQVSVVAEVSRIELGTYSYVAVLAHNLAMVSGADGALAIVDLSQASTPRILAQTKVANSTIGVAVAGTYAFVGARESGFLVVDLANPREPRVVANCDTGGDTRGVILQGQHAYAADMNSGLAVIDVSDPLHPRKVGQRHVTASKMERLTQWDHSIGVAGREGGLQIIDVSNPANPLFVGGYDTDQITVGVAVADDLAYLADEKGGLKIVDIHNPAEPVLIAQAPTQWAKSVAVSNQRAYVADYLEGLVIFDVAEPRNPKRLGAIATYGNAETVLLSGDDLYLVDGRGGLLVLRVFSHADNPVLQFCQHPEGQTLGRGGNATFQAKVIGTGPVFFQWHLNGEEIAGAEGETLIVPNAQAAQAGSYQLKVSNRAGSLWSRPAPLIVVESQGQLPLSAPAWGVAIQSSLAYVAIRSNGLAVVDIQNPATPRLLGSIDTPGDAMKVAVQGDYACVADRSGGLVVLDVRDPSNLRQLGKLNSTGETLDVVMEGQYAYLADNWGGIYAVDLQDPTTPRRLGNGKTFNYANGLCYRFGYAFVGDAGAGLRIYDVSHPLQIAFVDGADTPGWSTGVALHDGYAGVADQAGGLSLFDVSDPRNPRLVRRLVSAGTAQRVALSRGLALVANAADNLWLVDIRDPLSPTTIGHLPTGGDARDVAVAGDVVCVADGNKRLTVFKTIFVPAVPTILQTPESRLCTPGETVALSVTAEGNGPLQYQWYRNGSAISGAIAASLTIPDFDAGKQGSYCVEVIGRLGSTRSVGASLSLPLTPVILTQPTWGSADTGLDLSLRARAAGAGVLSYQWFKDGIALPGATSAEFVLSAARRIDSGIYTVRVSNTYGSVDSQPLALSVAFDGLDLLSNKSLGTTAYAVKTLPGYAFVAAGTAGLLCLDISAPSNARVIGTFDTPGFSKGVCLASHYAFVADGKEEGTPGLRIIDVSMPVMPTLAGSLNTGGDSADVAVRDGLAYVADGPRGLQIVDVANPQSPRALGVWDTPGYAVKVVLTGRYAFVADRAGGLQILDIADSGHPRIAGAYDTPGTSVGVTVQDNLLFVADEEGGLLSFDITNPVKPVLQSSFRSGFAKSSAVAGSYMFLGDWSSGLFMVDFSDPKLPWAMKHWRGGNGEGVAVAGNLVCVADGGRGFSVFTTDRLTGLQNHTPQLGPVGDQTLNAGETLSFAVEATDEDVPPQPLTFRLGPDAPPGASITCDGRFTWSPYDFQGGSANLITILVSDYWSTTSQTFQVVVRGSPGIFVLPGTIAWYPLQGDAKDYGPHGYDGAFQSVYPAYDRFSKAQAASSLDGSGYIAIPSFAWPSQTSISISIWAKPTLPNTGTYQDIISKHSGGGNVAILMRTGPDGNYYCQWDVGGTLYSTRSAPPSGSGFDLLVLTYDGTHIRFYVNTSLVSSLPASGPVVNNSLPVTLGAKANELTKERFTGALDDLRFFDHALSPLEVLTLYAETAPQNHPPMLSPLVDRTGSEGNPIAFVVSAADIDVPSQRLTFILDAGAPSGATISPSGLFTWTPTRAQGPATFSLTVRVTDNGEPPLSDAQTFTVTVLESPGYEADVAPRPNGSLDGKVTVTDWVQVGRFVAGLDTPDPGSEFQRADCAPRDTFGNGALTVSDWVQAGRYAAGLDAVVGAGGPRSAELTPTSASASMPIALAKQAERQRAVEVRSLAGDNASGLRMAVTLHANGDENALGFSLAFDAAASRYRRSQLGAGAKGAQWFVNTSAVESGRIDFVLALPAGQTFEVGPLDLVEVQFEPVNAPGSPNAARFLQDPIRCEVVSVDARELRANWIGIAVPDGPDDAGHPGETAVGPVASMRASLVGGVLTISWPTGETNHVLESSLSVGSGAIWTPVPDLPRVAGGSHSVTLEATTATRFYRLRRQ